MKVSPARLAAYDILWRVTTEDAYASNLLASPRYENLASADHALAQELTLGVLRWQAQLDFFIEQFSRRKLNKLDREVVLALRLGLYQLHFLSRIPPHAAINESVNLVKLHKKYSATPMVNAVLRAVQRTSKEELALRINTIADSLEKLSIETAHPQWLLRRWRKRLGDDEARLLASANNHAAPTAFRFNERVHSEEQTRAWFTANEIQLRNSALVPKAAVIEAGRLSVNSDPVQANWIYLQDEASQLVAHLLARNPQCESRNLQFLDLCAAPGSKTTLLASLLPESALIVAGDLHLHRLQTMRALAARAQTLHVNVLQLDATEPLPFAVATQFEGVLLDAPCSGLGTLQRHPEIKWRVTEARLAELAALQKRLLENAAQQVRAGGLLVYSVCSTEPEEGEDVIAEFCAVQPEFYDVTRERLQELGLEAEEFLTPSFGARTFPHRQGCEGFYICVLARKR